MIFLSKPNKSPLSHINYRPIFILEIPGKITETIIKTQLTTYSKTNNYITTNTGFRSTRRTQTALTILYETIATMKGNGDRMNTHSTTRHKQGIRQSLT